MKKVYYVDSNNNIGQIEVEDKVTSIEHVEVKDEVTSINVPCCYSFSDLVIFKFTIFPENIPLCIAAANIKDANEQYRAISDLELSSRKG